MANIPFPNVSLERVNVSVNWPGQTVHRSLYTDDRQAITRGIGVWSGSITFPEFELNGHDQQIREIEAFFASLEGAVHTFDIPIPIGNQQQEALADGTALTATGTTRAGSLMQVTGLSEQAGLLQGNYVTISNNLFIVTTSLRGGTMTLSPFRPIVISGSVDVEWRNPTLRARATTSDPLGSPKNADFAGPWTIEIVGA